MNPGSDQNLRDELAALRAKLDEAEQTLQAIRSGDVDALIVGDALYTLDSANAAFNRLRRDVLAQMKDTVIALDNDKCVIYLNPAAESQYDLTSSQVLGHPLDRIYGLRWYSDEDRIASEKSIHETGGWRGELMHVRNDGEALHVETTLTTLRDALGQATGCLIVSRDVSERYRQARALHEATREVERRQLEFATLVENAPFVFARFDRALRHTYVSPVIEKYTGRSAADFIGKRHTETGVPQVLSQEWDEALRTVFETGQVNTTRFAFDTPQAERCQFECRLIPERADDGNVESVLSMAIDVTEREAADIERRAAAASLIEQDRRKDIFLATLAHELRNPLAPIANALQIMRMATDAPTRDMARRMIERQQRQLVHLVDDLLDVSRITQGKLALRMSRFALATVVSNAVETSRPLIEAAGHTLALDLSAADELVINGDLTRLTQVLANLLNNAAKYTPAGGRIVVQTQQQGSDAVLRVIDNGVGIAPHRLQDVFEMFAQVESSSGQSQGGLGIGLALVKHLVEMHGGRVAVSSEGSGRGSCFELRLPAEIVVAFPAEPAGSTDDDRSVGGGDGACILVVDDNRDSADSMAEMLSMLGFDTAVAYDGDEALQVAETLRPRAAIVDLGMPRLNGEAVARHLRATPWAAGMLLIALSGWGRDDDRQRTQAAGFDHHFVKPIDFNVLAPLLTELATLKS